MTLAAMSEINRARIHAEACWQAVIRADTIQGDVEAATAYLAARQALAALRKRGDA